MEDLKKLYEAPKQKERHIVTWTQQEDDILREQISIHGTENWTIIAANFKDKTTRQCRRRWYTYLNSDFKKGGWSPEEDMILCEAQKIFGNRWTEIAKVVSGRTDNAVKNRFSTLCKKKAKHEALEKKNTSYSNLDNKRIISENRIVTDTTSESAAPLKKLRTHVSGFTENCNPEGKSLGECGTTMNQQVRPPFAVLVQNLCNVSNLSTEQHLNNNTRTASDDIGNSKVQGTFLKKDDPKITALIQQAELLSSLALKVNTENTNRTLENAWKELQDFLNQNKESDLLRYKVTKMDFLFEDFKGLVEDLKNSNMEIRLSERQPDLYESSTSSSEYSTGSTVQCHTAGDKKEQAQAEVCSLHQDAVVSLQSIHVGEQNGGGDCKDIVCTGTCTTLAGIFSSCDKPKDNDGIVSALPNAEFSSPLQVTPLFQSLAAGIPSPKFSESERRFLLKTLGLAYPSPNPTTKRSQTPPPCRRALLHSL
ncbi:hypothetical protein HHK36_029759 [Tetracentron sinense]|uniref:Uncharacterized protein n=1 Tax=Tetracentron sinense TaxID=13715 RepID=A0A834YFU3_TETSI|nr:hypothetical protein HHK36_029759 [Tetracentron sinense]